MCCVLVYICLFGLYVAVWSEPISRLVNTTSGPVLAYRDSKEDIFVFYGIPYAKAPSGPDRFKAPHPPPVWSKPLEAVDQTIVCPHYDFFNLTTAKLMQEDCLIANIYIPNKKENNLPVVVYVHGGGFILGFGGMISLKEIVATKKIIAITFNYRLGAHGFLCLGTKGIPGNAGMKDQIALLRWVKNNIASFGGDPDNIAVSGFSAGASSAELLMLSEMAKGLFNKVIPESGASTAAFSVQVDPVPNAKEYGRLLGFSNVDDLQALEDFFISESYEGLQSGDIGLRTDLTFLMAPCVERDVGEEIFLKDSPYNIINSGNYNKVPMLFGFSNMEGLMRIDEYEQWKDLMNKNFADFIPPDLKFESENEKNVTIDNIKMFYFGGKPVSEENILGYVNYISDIMFTYPTLRSIKQQVASGNDQIYLYEYSFNDVNTPLVPHTQVRGVGHCAQTDIVADPSNRTIVPEDALTDEFKKMRTVMRETWINFITTGKPEGDGLSLWPPVHGDSSPHMALKTNPELRGSLLKERTLFWEKIYEKHYHAPSAP